MLVIRPLSALTGLLILALLSRRLPSEAYGLYFSIWAAVELLILVSNVGLMHAAYRYVSATQWQDGRLSIQGPAARLLAWRMASVLLFSLVLLAWGPQHIDAFKAQGDAQGFFILLALLFCAEGIARFVEILFDAMMLQGLSQFTTVARNVLRLAGVSVLLYGFDSAQIKNVLLVEVVACTIGALLAVGLFLRVFVRRFIDPDENVSDISAQRFFKFVAPAFVAQVLGTFYGPDSIKLIMNSTAGAAAVAGFGFSYSIVAIVQRYMPVNMFVGLFRALFVAASDKRDADDQLGVMFNFIVKINAVFILAGFVAFRIAADTVMSAISGGRYGAYADVMAMLLLGLVPVAVHLTISLYCLAKETSFAPLLATMFSACALPLTFYLTRHYGAMGGAVLFLVSEAIWVLASMLVLRAGRMPLPFRWGSYLKLAAVCLLCALAPEVVHLEGLAGLIFAVLMALVFLLLVHVVKVFDRHEVALLGQVLPSRFVVGVKA